MFFEKQKYKLTSTSPVQALRVQSWWATVISDLSEHLLKTFLFWILSATFLKKCSSTLPKMIFESQLNYRIWQLWRKSILDCPEKPETKLDSWFKISSQQSKVHFAFLIRSQANHLLFSWQGQIWGKSFNLTTIFTQKWKQSFAWDL